jgi:hypothetical protein
MGYYVESEISNLLIKDTIGALQAINDLHTPKGMDNNNPGGGTWRGEEQVSRHYSWVNNPPEGGFKTLKEWNFEGDSTDERFEITYDICSKLGDQETFYRTIAPFVDEDAEVIMEGEDDCIWKYTFKGGKLKETHGEKRIVWEDE